MLQSTYLIVVIILKLLFSIYYNLQWLYKLPSMDVQSPTGVGFFGLLARIILYLHSHQIE